MKKLMVAFAVIASAVVANAGAVNWSLDQVYKSDGSGEVANGYSAYFFVDSYTGAGFTGGSDYVFSALDAAAQIQAGKVDFVTHSLALLGDNAAVALTDTGYAVDFNVGAEDYTSVPGGMFVDNSTLADTVKGYFVIFDAETAAEANYAYIVDPVTIEMSSGEGSFDLYASGTATKENWTAVATPEPTSGLLLLLGVAGLALRRRRA